MTIEEELQQLGLSEQDLVNIIHDLNTVALHLILFHDRQVVCPHCGGGVNEPSVPDEMKAQVQQNLQAQEDLPGNLEVASALTHLGDTFLQGMAEQERQARQQAQQ